MINGLILLYCFSTATHHQVSLPHSHEHVFVHVSTFYHSHPDKQCNEGIGETWGFLDILPKDAGMEGSQGSDPTEVNQNEYRATSYISSHAVNTVKNTLLLTIREIVDVYKWFPYLY